MSERFYCNSGKRNKIIYKPRIDKAGVIHLVKDSDFDLYADIQTHKDSVNIHVLMARYKSGETNVLNKVNAFYADVSHCPTTYADCLNLVNDVTNLFNSLPVDERKKFGFDVNRYIASLGVISQPIKSVEPVPAAPEKESEVKE